MSHTSDEDIRDYVEDEIEADRDETQYELGRSDGYPTADHINSDNKVNDQVLKYQKEIERISYLLKEKNLIINKLMIALSNQTQDMIKLEKAYHSLRHHVFKTKNKSKSLSNKDITESEDRLKDQTFR